MSKIKLKYEGTNIDKEPMFVAEIKFATYDKITAHGNGIINTLIELERKIIERNKSK